MNKKRSNMESKLLNQKQTMGIAAESSIARNDSEAVPADGGHDEGNGPPVAKEAWMEEQKDPGGAAALPVADAARTQSKLLES